jgi:hypothetical protein
LTLFGWDASKYDWDRGPMDLGAAARAGISFFTHKITEGNSTVHTQCGAALQRARDAGIPFLGVYHVPRSGPSVAAQRDYFMSKLNSLVPWWKSFPGFFVQVDTEKWDYDAVSAARGHDVCVALASATGRKVVHYAPEWAYGNGIPGNEPLWASNYVGGGNFRSIYPGDNSSRWHAYSGRTPAILQYSATATIGSQSNCDANAFRGSVDDFARLIGAQEEIPDMQQSEVLIENTGHPGRTVGQVLADGENFRRAMIGDGDLSGGIAVPGDASYPKPGSPLYNLANLPDLIKSALSGAVDAAAVAEALAGNKAFIDAISASVAEKLRAQ